MKRRDPNLRWLVLAWEGTPEPERDRLGLCPPPGSWDWALGWVLVTVLGLLGFAFNLGVVLSAPCRWTFGLYCP